MDATYSGKTKGYLAEPKNPNGAGVVIIHEFWGLTEQIKKTADKIAREGFTVLALDLYEGKKAETREQAQNLKKNVTTQDAVKNIEAGLNYLQKEWNIPIKKSAVWGFCFGGGIAFDAATYPTAMGAVVIYYGPINDDPEIVEKLAIPLLGIFGGKDHAIKAELAQRFHTTLHSQKKEHEIYIYPEAGHAFANEERENFHESSAKDAWQKTITFLKKRLS